jgi:hypothetical protein
MSTSGTARHVEPAGVESSTHLSEPDGTEQERERVAMRSGDSTDKPGEIQLF